MQGCFWEAGNNHHFKLVCLVARPAETTRGRAKLSFPKVFWNHWIWILELGVTQMSLNPNFIFYEHKNWDPVRLPDLAKITQPSINRGSLEVNSLTPVQCILFLIEVRLQFFLHHLENIYQHLVKHFIDSSIFLALVSYLENLETCVRFLGISSCEIGDIK